MVVPPSTIHNYFNLIGIDETTARWESFDRFSLFVQNEKITSDPNLHTSPDLQLLTATGHLAAFLLVR